MIETLMHRGTVREYDERPISDQVLNQLLEAACRASNTGNMQLYSIIVTRSQAQKEALLPCHFGQAQIMSAPVVLTFCVDVRRYSQWCLQRQAQPGFHNVQSFVYAAIDAIIAAQTFCVAAEAEGLGICYLGTTTYNSQQIIEALALPKGVMPITTLTVGYPKQPAQASERLPLEAIVHEENYRDYSADDIDRLFEAKENWPANKHYVAINQKETLAQVFTDLRYKKQDNEFFSEAFVESLRKQGFIPA